MIPTGSDHAVVEAWRAHRRYLVDLAFGVLGDAGVAEDVVQDAFARLANLPAGAIENPRAWLSVVTSRLCLDHLRSARNRREYPAEIVGAARPVGQYAAVDPADRVTLDDEVRLALSVVLDRLSPAERVAFVLHDVFQTPFDQIARTTGRPVGTCRQLARRARRKLAAASGRAAPAEYREVTERFLTACATGDVDRLVAVLDPDIWGLAETVDGKPLGPPVHRDRRRVAATFLRHFGYPEVRLVSHPLSGTPVVLAYRAGSLAAVVDLTIRADSIAGISVLLVDPRP